MELSFLAGLSPMAAELSGLSLHLVRIFFYLFFFNKEGKVDGISPSSCTLCAVVILHLSCLIPVSGEREEKIKVTYCRCNVCNLADAVPDFTYRPPSCIASGRGRLRLKGKHGCLLVSCRLAKGSLSTSLMKCEQPCLYRAVPLHSPCRHHEA